MGKYQDLKVYTKAFELAMKIYHLSLKFPSDEKFGLTSQIRRSSRSVCSNIAEGYRKRRYEPHFISKLTDADMKNSETIVWIDFAISCGFINAGTKDKLTMKTEEIRKLLYDKKSQKISLRTVIYQQQIPDYRLLTAD